MRAFLRNFVYKPILLLFIKILGFVPGGSLGLSIIIITVFVKIILLPISLKASKSALKMRDLQPKINALKINYPDKQQQTLAIMELYKKEKVNPFSSFVSILIQIPILIALYKVLSISFVGGEIPFGLTAPLNVNQVFLGIDLASKSIILAVLVGLAQFFMARITANKKDDLVGDDMQTQMTRSMQTQAKYVLPVIMAIVSYATNGALSLYILLSIVLAIVQEVFVRNYYAKRS